jgi:glyceraldehyde 3-phosphate dehydrogenase
MAGAEMVVGINGYGRIGRAFHRLTLLDPTIRVAAVNSRSDAETLGHLLTYDSMYGELDADVVTGEQAFSVSG